MKFLCLAIIIGTLTVLCCSAFVVQQPASKQHHHVVLSKTVLFDSRQRQKQASRQAWNAKRGLLDGSSTTTISAESSSALVMKKNADGLEYVQLTNDKGDTADVYLYGGVVTSYVVNGVDYIAVRPDAKMDGSKPISGGLSHCWPQFGPGAIQQHGFARNVNWTVVESSSSNQVTLSMIPSDYTKGIWDKDFACQFTVTLQDDQLLTKMHVANTGTESWSFQAALHSYFTTSALSNLEITGSFAGKQFLNKMAGSDGKGEMQTEERNVITIGEEYDRVYMGVNDPVLKDSGKGTTLSVLNTAGWTDTVLWNPYGNTGMGYNNFVCVESVKFDPVSLAGSATWDGEMALKVTAL